MMITAIWFLFKHPWWCSLGFYQPQSILNPFNAIGHIYMSKSRDSATMDIYIYILTNAFFYFTRSFASFYCGRWKELFFPSFFYNTNTREWHQVKEKNAFVRMHIYTSMVAEDHILGYDKNILQSFRQNVLGIERVNDDYCDLISVQASLMMITAN